MEQTKLNKNKVKLINHTYWNYTEQIILEMKKPVREWPNKIINVIPMKEKHLYTWI